MKDLFQYLREDDKAIPGNTMGMGDPIVNDGDGKGTEPIPTAKSKKEHPRRKHKKNSEEE